MQLLRRLGCRISHCYLISISMIYSLFLYPPLPAFFCCISYCLLSWLLVISFYITLMALDYNMPPYISEYTLNSHILLIEEHSNDAFLRIFPLPPFIFSHILYFYFFFPSAYNEDHFPLPKEFILVFLSVQV